MARVFSLALACAALNSVSAFVPRSTGFSTRTQTRTSRNVLSMKKEIAVKEEWVPVLSSKDISAGELVGVEVDGLSLLVAADLDGKVYCVANVCPHLGTPLENGRIGEGTIICPLHRSAFALQTGEPVGDWCPFPPIVGPLILGKLSPPRNLATFPIRSKGSNIEVFVDRNLKLRYESKYWSGLLDAQGKATGDYY